MSLLIKQARLVTDVRDEICDILIQDGKVKSIASSLDLQADEVINAKGMILIPGGVDAHTHMELPMMGTQSCDNFEQGTIAAVAGGTTTIIDFANQAKGESLHTTLDKWLKKSKNKKCETRFHVSITDVNERTIHEMKEIYDRGVRSFKTFLAYKGMRLNDDELRSVMKEAVSIGALVTAHCEMGEQIERNVEQYLKEEKIAPKYHPQTRPPVIEGEATEHFLKIGKEMSCPSYVVHMSCKESVDALRKAKSSGQKCFGETCIQYLFLDDSLYEQEFEQASRYILSPPLRDRSHQAYLWEAISDGTVDVVATDHCPFTTKQRELGRSSFTHIPNGLGGVEERMILMYSEGVRKGRISLKRFVEVCCSNPAKIFGLYPQKGTLEEGSGADFVLIDPMIKWRLSNNQLHHQCDYTCYEGHEIQGKIVKSSSSF